ncbi:MAG: GspH/FimT family pseudopilin [Proteobacteria bacterium]|nr:GspH/FimT family pseudopilin [Pseudomonadota bacterium]
MKSPGFTLIEMLLVLAIISVILTLSLMSGFNLIERNRMTKEMDQIILAINFAKSAAVQYGTSVTLCKSVDKKTCSGRWKDGQIVFLDPSIHGKVQSSENILRTFPALNDQSQLEWRGFYSNDFISFDPSGIQKLSAGSFKYSPSHETTEFAHKIILNRMGRIRITQSS